MIVKKVVEINNPEVYICEKDKYGVNIVNFATNADNTNKVYDELYPDSSWIDNCVEEGYGIEPRFEKEQLDAVLDLGESAYFFIYFCWNSSSEKSPEPFSANWKVEFNWEQVTA